MTPDRKKPGVAFWATVVVIVLAAYPLSIGPLYWLNDRDMLPQDGIFEELTDAFYAPLSKLPEPIQRALYWYQGLWGESHPKPAPQS